MARTMTAAGALTGRRAVVTGATGGLGFEVALGLAWAGAEVMIASRDSAKGAAALDRLRGRLPDAVVGFRAIDLARLTSVGAFAAAELADGRPLDLLINNAGLMAPPTRRVTQDGFERQFGVNYLGHFALTGRLLPLLRAARAARVVNVSSLAHRVGALDFDDLQSARYAPWRAYGRSKLAMIAFTHELQRRSDARAWPLRAVAAHPGWAATDLVKPRDGERVGLGARLLEAAGLLFGQSAAEGARPILFAAVDPTALAGGYYGPGGPGELRGAPKAARLASFASDAAMEARLWSCSEALTGVKFG